MATVDNTDDNEVSGSAREIQEQVEAIVQAMAPVGDGAIGPDTRLVEDLGYYSLRLFELSMTLELRFKIELPLEETMEVRTIDGVRALVTKLAEQRLSEGA
jgi:acyl carrier protein